MDLVLQALALLGDPARWASADDDGWATQIRDHVVLSAICLAVAALIALPLGLYVGHTGKGRRVVVPALNVLRALPTFGLFALLVIVVASLTGAVIPLVLLGVPSLLAGAYAGLESVDKQTVDAARAVGMTEWQVLGRVELPLAAPLLLGGVRAATLQIVATATLVFFFGYNSLGNSILTGVATRDYPLMIAGALLVTALALLLDALLGLVQRFAVPRGVSRGSGSPTTTARARRGTALPTRTPIPEGN